MRSSNCPTNYLCNVILSCLFIIIASGRRDGDTLLGRMFRIKRHCHMILRSPWYKGFGLGKCHCSTKQKIKKPKNNKTTATLFFTHGTLILGIFVGMWGPEGPTMYAKDKGDVMWVDWFIPAHYFIPKLKQ